MKKFTFVCTALLLFVLPTAPGFSHQAPGGNSCPIILVHGFGGWGPGEVPGFRCWGGIFDLKGFLDEQGYTVYEASVGAVASNWDRAIELYYQIKGGQVDYGSEHSAAYGHLQRPEGKFYDAPFYPQWNADNPVHLIGKSMGGQTVRMLATLLAGKSPEFQKVLRDKNGTSFTPGEGWIKSVTTLSAPHNGSSLFDLIDNPVIIEAAILMVAGYELNDIMPDELYSFDLEQWGIQPQENETIGDYLTRIHETLGDTMDLGVRELTTYGAARFNGTVNLSTTDLSSYYFSFATEQTKLGPMGNFYFPALTMNPILISFSLILGTSPLSTDPLAIDIAWRENDGMVNTASMNAPLAGCDDRYAVYAGISQKGVWNYMDKISWDHIDITAQTQINPFSLNKLKAFHLSLAELLSSLE